MILREKTVRIIFIFFYFIKIPSVYAQTDLAFLITKEFYDPNIGGHGVANTYSDGKNNYIVVQWEAPKNSSVQKQIEISSRFAFKIGYFIINNNHEINAKDIVIKMSIYDSNYFENTFSIRYKWDDISRSIKSKSSTSQLAKLGKIESIWYDYWPIMCLNPPPKELFAGGSGEPEEPSDVKNPTNKDLSCHMATKIR